MSRSSNRKGSLHQDGKWGHQRLYGSTEIDSIEVEDMGNKAGYFSNSDMGNKKHWAVVAAALVLLVIFLAIGFGVSASSDYNVEDELDLYEKSENAGDGMGNSLLRESILGNYSKAAVASDGGAAICSQIGRKVMEEQNGTAADAAIATLFCSGLIASHSMGVGGGFLMTVYQKDKGLVTTIDAREAAPAKATEDMFHGDASLSSSGGLSVAIPGEIKGYAKAKEMFGNPAVSWESLIQPSIELARKGIPVTFSKAKALMDQKAAILNDPGMRSIYINPDTNDTWKEGDTYTRLNFANTLERIAKLGSEEFYQGTTAENFVKDLRQLGGIITLQDLKDYCPRVEEPIKIDIGNGLKLYSVPPPGSGIILAFILNIMENYNVTKLDANDPLMHHRLVEAFKYGYAYRSQIGDPSDSNITKLVENIVKELTSEEVAFETFKKINDSQTSNDPKYYGGDFQINEDHGTSHTSVLAPNGDAVAVTSTINLTFGAKIMSPSTGIIYNDEMDDFSSPGVVNEFNLPPSPHNFIKPGKRPQSSMCPVIILDSEGQVRIVTGAAGGTKITTSTAFTILHNLWLGEDIKSSIDAKRIHHQLEPMRVDYESGFSQEILNGLSSRGHMVNRLDSAGSTVSAITREKDGRVYANSDNRKAGGVAGF